MKIGLIAALREEIMLLVHSIDDLKVTKLGVREFYEGTIGGNEIVLCLSGWGKVAAASTATTMINRFGADQLVFIGLAGSLSDQLEIGDIVVADMLIQHDVDLSRLDGFHHLEAPFYKKFRFPVKAGSQKLALEAVKQFVFNLHAKRYPNLSTDYNPKIHIGPIGTGDQFIAGEKARTRITGRYPDLLCTEMEGAAIAQVANDYGIGCSVIRIISDKSDDSAHETFAKFLFENIDKISVEIAKLMFS